jgi:hypothetical protein
VNATQALLVLWVLGAVALVTLVGLTLGVLHLLSQRAHLRDTPTVIRDLHGRHTKPPGGDDDYPES